MDAVVFFVAMRFMLGCLFLFAGINKLRAPTRFYAAILTFKIVPPALARIIARLLPWIECLAGLALFIGVAARGMAILIAGLLLVFSGIFVVAWSRRLDVSCNCFGNQQDGELTSIPRALLRNLLLCTMAIPLFFAPASAQQVLLPLLQTPANIPAYLEAFIIAMGMLSLILLSGLVVGMLHSIGMLQRRKDIMANKVHIK